MWTARANDRIYFWREPPGCDSCQHVGALDPSILDLLIGERDEFNVLVRQVQGLNLVAVLEPLSGS
jgi:hypothetical protein